MIKIWPADYERLINNLHNVSIFHVVRREVEEC